jgi:hypothetical protein
VFSRLEGFGRPFEAERGGQGDVDEVDLGVGEENGEGGIGSFEGVLRGEGGGGGGGRGSEAPEEDIGVGFGRVDYWGWVSGWGVSTMGE